MIRGSCTESKEVGGPVAELIIRDALSRRDSVSLPSSTLTADDARAELLCCIVVPRRNITPRSGPGWVRV